MIKTLRVWAHWTDDPTPPLPANHNQLLRAPVPGTLLGYLIQGKMVPSNHGWPDWTNFPSGPTRDPVIVWCELARQNDIKNALWYGSQGFPPPAFSGQNDPSTGHPDYGDEGYDDIAIGIKVSKITVFLELGLNNDYQFDIYDPNGSLIATWLPDGQSSYTFSLTAPYADHKGIWSIHIDRAPQPIRGAPQSTAKPPTLLGGYNAPNANKVDEPYVAFLSSYGPAALPPVVIGMEFEGEEVYNCPEVTITHEEATECVNGKREVTLKATVTASANSPATGQWVFSYDGGNTFVSGPNSSFYVAQGQTKNIQTQWDYPCGPNNTACLRFDQGANPGCDEICSEPFQVTSCPVTCEVRLDYSPKPIPCGKPQTINFVATFDPNYGGSYYWYVKDGNKTTIHSETLDKSLTPNPNDFSYTFINFDTYEVIITVNTPGCEDSNGHDIPFASDSSGDLVIGDCCGSNEHWDKVKKECVPNDNPPPKTSDCSVWCMFFGFIVAFLISEHISTAAHCLSDPYLDAARVAVIGIAITFYIVFCGFCCVWRFMILGCILGIIATLIYWYWWGGYPKCWFTGLILLSGYFTAAIGWLIACNRQQAAS